MSTTARMIRGTARGLGLASVLTALGLAAMPAANAGAASTGIQPTPNPAGSKGSFLKAVSCPTATTCFAVGYYQSSAGPLLMFAERWNGQKWKITKTPSPGGAVSSDLEAISCTSATACIAVGSLHYPVGGAEPLAERWNGTKWTPELPQVPVGAAFGLLSGVSCSSAASCTAVGTTNAGGSGAVDHTFAEGWNGTNWTIQATQDPSGSLGASLHGVSCPSAGSCVAVGNWANGGKTFALAQRWNGSGWFFEIPPNKSPRNNVLTGVSCASSTACTAVGYYADPISGFPQTLGELSTGTATWTLQTTPSPGRTHSFLAGVSCAAAQSNCTAVGSMDSVIGIDQTLGVFWDGFAWSFGSTPTIPNENTYLYGVSCTSATVCTAVGTYKNTGGTYVTFAERYS